MVKILNLGCGWNHIDKALNVDINPECKPDKIVDFEKKLPFKNNSFDKIISTEVFEHIKNIDQLVKECRRILKPKGELFISVPYHGFLKNLLTLFYFDIHFSPIGGHIRFFTKSSIVQFLTYRGFKIEKIELKGRIKPLARVMNITARKK